MVSFLSTDSPKTSPSVIPIDYRWAAKLDRVVSPPVKLLLFDCFGVSSLHSACSTGGLCFFISSVAQLCPTLCNPMDCSMPGIPVHHQLPKPTQSHVHWVSDAIQSSHSLLSPSPPAFNLSQHQGLFQWISSLHQMAKVLEFQLQHQSFQWIFRTVSL